MTMSPQPPADEQPVVAAIHNDGLTDIDAALAQFVQSQRRAGRRVLGLLMKLRAHGADCHASMVLTDIDTGDEYPVSQALGAGSNACSADPQGFALASRVLRDALGRRPDLVVCNRFGVLEAEGGGFAAELLDLLAQGVPVLTVVSSRHLPAWRHFIGDAPLLEPEPAAWASWFDAVLAGRDAVSA